MDKFAELHTFIEVVGAGDYSRAARRLHLTPSAVSRAVKRLEDRLGVCLLHRTSRAMHLTADGETFYRGACEAVSAVREAELSISGSLSHVRGDLRIQVPPTFALFGLADTIPQFQKLCPAVRLEFLLRNEQLDMAEHRIDVAIRIGRQPDSGLISRKITSVNMVYCASPAYLDRHGTPTSLLMLKQHKTIGYSLDPMVRSASNEFPIESSHALSHKVAIAANNASMHMALARAGCGIVQLAEYHVHPDLKSGRLVQLLPDIPSEPEDVFVVYPQGTRNSAKIRAFVSFLADRAFVDGWGDQTTWRKVALERDSAQ